MNKLKAKIQTIILRIKGTRHYQTDLALTSGELGKSSDIYLVPEPTNPHDKNVVSVIAGVITSNATRTSSAEIEAHIQSLTPAL